MKATLIGLLFLGLTTLCYSQIEDESVLTEIEVYAKNYDYLKSVNSDDLALAHVNKLERKVANFDIISLNLPHYDYNLYKVNFFIPDGSIRAHYDNQSNVIETIEKFENIGLPISVRRSVVSKYPDHLISAGEYQVRYHHKRGTDKKYKILMEKEGKKIWVKSDENGVIR